MDSPATSIDDPLKKALARVAELEDALVEAERTARSASLELQHFVYAASHDLQEPLRAITTYSQLLERMYASDPQTHELTTFISTGVLRMNSLLQSLLAYSRMNLSPALSRVNLNGPLQTALFKLGPLIQQTGAVVHVGDLPEVAAHEVQMGQLFEQIISNAILYRRDAPVIHISALDTEVNGDPSQVLCIKDNGVGIEQQFLTQVIQPFKRLHGKDIPGNGLGLAICEKIMRAHRGRLWLESDGTNGTQVYVAFPH